MENPSFLRLVPEKCRQVHGSIGNAAYGVQLDAPQFRVVRNLHLVCDVGAHKTINEGSYARTTAMKTESVILTRDELSNAITSPVSVFDFPLEVVACPGLSKDQKIEILKRWELDARALQRATDENMDGGEPPLLDEVNRALMMLDPENATADHFGDSPTKI